MKIQNSTHPVGLLGGLNEQIHIFPDTFVSIVSYPLGWLVVLAGAKDAGLRVNGLLLSYFPSLAPLCAEELLCALACASVQSPVSHRLSLELPQGQNRSALGVGIWLPGGCPQNGFAPSIFGGAPPWNPANPGLTKPAWGKLALPTHGSGPSGDHRSRCESGGSPQKKSVVYIFTYSVSPPGLDSQRRTAELKTLTSCTTWAPFGGLYTVFK